MTFTVPSKTIPLGAGNEAYVGQARPSGGAGAGQFNLVPGELKSIHMNSLVAQNPCPADNCWYSEASKQNGPWANWCNAVFATDYSELGAMVYWGGGHGGYDGTEFYIFDLTTQMWSRLNDPIPYDFLPQTGADWCDVLYNGNYIAPASHTYGGAVYWPAAIGGGVKGSWILPYNVYGAAPETDGYGTVGYRPHAVDLNTGAWTRLTDNTRQPYYPGAAQGSNFVDKNGILWGIQGSSSDVHVKIDLAATGTKTITNYDGHLYTPGFYTCHAYMPTIDMLVVGYSNYGQSGAGMVIYDLTIGSGAMDFYPTATNAPNMPNINPGFGFDWCPDTEKFYAYAGLGDTTVHVLTPPGPLATARAAGAGNWKTGTWEWSMETIGGEAPVNLNEVTGSSQGGQPFSKWRYHPTVKAFMWSQGTVVRNSPDGVPRSGAFQLYRPLGVTG